MMRSKPTVRRPRHARPSLLAPTRSLPAAITLLLLVALGIAGCAAVAGSHPVSSRPRAGGPSIPHLVPDHAVAAQEVQFRATDVGGGISGTWFTTGGGAAGGATAAGSSTAAPDPTTTSALAGSGIPLTALTAYKQAAAREAVRRPGCGIVWPLLAGIGRVESNHGRFAGAVLHTDGYSTPRIVGIPLDGHGTALIRDTDQGRLDGDTVYDRAVGPMQFIPSTWAGWGVDANHDGRTDPNNIFDAAAAAADYLCAAGRNLRTYAGQVQAVRSYNDSDAYIAMVLGLEKAYASGAVGVTIPVLPTDPHPGTVHPPHPPKLPPVDPGKPRGIPPKSKPTPTPGSTGSTPAGSTSSAPAVPPSGSTSAPGNGTASDPGTATPTDIPTGSSPTDVPPTDVPPTDVTPTDTPSSTSPGTGTPSAGTAAVDPASTATGAPAATDAPAAVSGDPSASSA